MGVGIDVPEKVNAEVIGTKAPQQDVCMENIQLKIVKIRLYRQPRDWVAVHELNFCCEPNGAVNLEKVRHEFGVEGKCRVCPRFLWIQPHLISHTLDN